MAISVTILDDRQLFREGMRLLLGSRRTSRRRRSGQASEGDELIATRHPDVCIVAEELEEVGAFPRRVSCCAGARRCATW